MLDRISCIDPYEADFDIEDYDVDRVLRHITAVGTTSATGFLISPRLLLTNYHVFANEIMADKRIGVEVHFDFEEHRPRHPVIGTVNSTTFFWSDKKLDAAVVAWEPADGDKARVPIQILETSPVPSQPIKGDTRLLVIGHPEGKAKRLSMHGCRLKLKAVSHKPSGDEGDFIIYSNDTEGGSSGSPVLNMHGALVALHHSTAYRTHANSTKVKHDKRGNPLYEYNYGTNVGAIFRELLRAFQAETDPGKKEMLHEALKAGATPKTAARFLNQQVGQGM